MKLSNKEERLLRRIAKREANKRLNDMSIERPKWLPVFAWKWLLNQIIKEPTE